MTYEENLENTKVEYPFERWRELFFPDPEDDEAEGMEQYTQENCDAAKLIFDSLIDGLKTLGEGAQEKDKVELFRTAVEDLNKLNEKVDDLIETGEREDLCELIDQITIASGLNPEDYADGNGIADNWRNW
jgi:hypothetical protein